MSEFHVDKLVSNLQGMQVNIRVGSNDRTTHPYFSRRMYRLLQVAGIGNSTYEELQGKEHWWWDTKFENDGGVLNDPTMRQFYQRCHSLSQDLSNNINENLSSFRLTVINVGAHTGMVFYIDAIN